MSIFIKSIKGCSSRHYWEGISHGLKLEFLDLNLVCMKLDHW